MEGEEKDFEVDISHEGKEKSSGSSPHPESEEHVEKEKKLTVKELKKKLEAKEAEIKELYDRLLRTQAEFENYKKRIAREKGDLMKYANEELIKEIIPALDSLELAIAHAPDTDQVEHLVEGIEIILKQLSKSLERFGMRGFVSVGEKFDPTRHEALLQVESAEQEPDTILTETQKGYFLHDRLLRPALVTVAKAPGGDADEHGE